MLIFKVHCTQFSCSSCPYCFDIHQFDRCAAWHRCLTDLDCLLISQLLHHCQCSSAHPEPSRSQPNQDQTSSSSSLSSLLSFLPSLSSFHLRELYSTFANHLFCFGFFPPHPAPLLDQKSTQSGTCFNVLLVACRCLLGDILHIQAFYYL